MAHVTLLFSALAFFSSIFALTTLVVMVASGRDPSAAWRIPLVGAFTLWSLSQGADLYVGLIGLGAQPWAYEIAEISVVLLVPAFGLVAYRTLGERSRRWFAVVLTCIATLASVAYVYANYVSIAAWPVLYPTYANAMIVSLVVASVTYARSGAPWHVPIGVASGLAGIAIVATDLFGLERAALELPPLVCTIWSAAFLADAFSALLTRTATDVVLDPGPVAERAGLSEREREVVALLLAGSRYDEIGERLFISKATVKTHISRAYAKLEVRSKMELVHLILRDS